MPAIKNFGHLWDRNRVFWGRPNVSGTLLGSHSSYGTVDFRDQKGIYLLHTDDFKVVYIGQVGSGNQTLFERLRQHTRSDELWNRWRYVSWFGWRGVNKDRTLSNYSGGSPSIKASSEAFLDEVEAVLIQVAEPPLNRQGPRWKDTIQFKQEDDPELELSDLPTIAARQANLIDEVQRLSERVTKQK